MTLNGSGVRDISVCAACEHSNAQRIKKSLANYQSQAVEPTPAGASRGSWAEALEEPGVEESELDEIWSACEDRIRGGYGD